MDRDLALNGDQEAWLTLDANLYVHFGLRKEDVTLDVAKNVMMLYGLFEDEIERWLASDQRVNRYLLS
jgi:hypothetical protein